jgi:pimeloyl-ACP methyl ester carboxylesterase
MDTYADDLSELIETLGLKGAVLIGFSAGGGEVAHYIGRHGTKQVAKAALIQYRLHRNTPVIRSSFPGFTSYSRWTKISCSN